MWTSRRDFQGGLQGGHIPIGWEQPWRKSLAVGRPASPGRQPPSQAIYIRPSDRGFRRSRIMSQIDMERADALAHDYDMLMDLIRNRTSVRKLKPDPIPDDSVSTVLEAGRW